MTTIPDPLHAVEIEPDRWASYDDATARYYIVSRDDLERFAHRF